MPDRFDVFLSYAHRYRDWVKTLGKNLEMGLGHHGRRGKVFLDDSDLGAGRSWVGQLERGLAESDHFVLVVSPEALASPWARSERDGFLVHHRDRREVGLQLAFLVDAPLGPFLQIQEYADFREHDEASYRRAYRELLAGLLGRPDRRNLPAPPPDLEIPAPPDPGLPPALRQELINALSPELRKRRGRVFVQSALELKSRLEGYPTPEAAASAALVHATGADNAVSAALRVIDVLAAELRADEEPEAAGRLETLRARLRDLDRDDAIPDLLSSYRDWVAGSHARLIDYFQQKTEFELLDSVYVEAELQTEERLTLPEAATAALEAGKVRPKTGLRSPMRVRDLLTLDSASVPRVTGRWVILGDPGAGKTTLVRHLAATLAREVNAPWVPVYVSLPRALREGGDLLERLERRLGKAGRAAQGLRGVLAREAQRGRLLFLLDGLDEVPRDDRDDAEALLRLLADYETPILVTSRPIGYRRPDRGFREVRLLPFDRQRRRAFLARWFGRRRNTLDQRRADDGLALLSADAGLWELSGNPLYLTLMALILEEGLEPTRNRTRLYDQVFELLLDGRHRPEGQPIDGKRDVRAALQYLGFCLTEDNRDAAPQEELERRLYRAEADSFRVRLERVARWRGSMRVFLDSLARRTGIIGPHDGEDADWRFWHRTFREALAAEELERRMHSGGSETILAQARDIAGHESGWAEPYALLTARAEDPDALVRELMRANSTLGLRALATAERIRDDTIRELLALSGGWEERAEVYRRLPELVGEGERALRLLDRLRRRTRSGNDLFFLDLAVQSVGKRWPSFAGPATKVRSRLFDHIPTPPDRLFEEIETPHGGTASLWTELPAGKHWVGSSEDAGAPYERPRHELMLGAPLRITSVPVTNAQFETLDADHARGTVPGEVEGELGHHPVIKVTWFEAVTFCRWLAARVPNCAGARLPSEEEWEAACRAGAETAYWSGNEEADLARVGWYYENSGRRTHRVGEKPANPWGLYDVHGNVWEWTSSLWRDSYSEPAPEEQDAMSGRRVFRGGSFYVAPDLARSANRLRLEPNIRDLDLGFRVVVPA